MCGGNKMLKKVEGIVIRTNDYGESNKVITLYTRELGKVGIMSRGAKKPRSRLAAGSQLFMYGIFLYHQGSGLGTLTQADIIDSFRDVRNDLFTAAYAMYMIELTDKLTEEHQTNPYLFQLLYQMLHNLNEGVDAEVLMRIFEVKMLAVAGIKPELNECVSCNRTEMPHSFSIKEAGFLCKNCSHQDEHAYPLSAHTARLLRLFYYIDLERLGNISLKKETKQELKKILSSYYDEYSGLRLKSKRFLEQVERMNES